VPHLAYVNQAPTYVAGVPIEGNALYVSSNADIGHFGYVSDVMSGLVFWRSNGTTMPQGLVLDPASGTISGTVWRTASERCGSHRIICVTSQVPQLTVSPQWSKCPYASRIIPLTWDLLAPIRSICPSLSWIAIWSLNCLLTPSLRQP